MKKRILFLLPVILCFVFESCMKDKVLLTYTLFRPVYKEKAEVFASIKSSTPVTIEKPGKLFLYNQ